MKLFTYILSVIALAFIIYNLTVIDYNAPFEGDSIVAVITVVAGLCAIILLAILRISKKIESLQRKR